MHGAQPHLSFDLITSALSPYETVSKNRHLSQDYANDIISPFLTRNNQATTSKQNVYAAAKITKTLYHSEKYSVSQHEEQNKTVG